MKIVVMNFSGNVGKSTVARQLLEPRIPGAWVVEVESLNESANGGEVEKMRGKQFGEIVDDVMQRDSAIIDVGASNVEEFSKRMQQYAGSHEEFDFFVIPTVKEKKQQADTVNTIRALAALGVPRSKIRTIFNKVEMDETVQEEFAALFGLAAAEKSFTLRPDAVIYNNEVFDRLKSAGKSLGDLNNDPTDYRAKLRETQDPDEKAHCVAMVALKRLAVTANKNLDDAFNALFAK